jgi:serine acetyltransferase/glycosyltransferase involved in cell wall biosynthesis
VESAKPTVSVVIATFNRAVLLERLLNQLARQHPSPSAFEVVVVDDGSAERVKPRIGAMSFPYHLRVIEQENRGAAAARHHGISEASGEILVLVDDDMQVPREFVAAHCEAHEPRGSRVVLGQIKPDPAIAQMPLFERFQAAMLDRRWAAFRSGATKPSGADLYTGNVSMRRTDYLAAGGLDASLLRSEDVELGIRLEEIGAEVIYSERAYSIHGSDHQALEAWRKSSRNYGVFDRRIAQKHADLRSVSPYRFLGLVNPISRPILALTVLGLPGARRGSDLAMAAALGLDSAGLESPALAATTLVYGMDYFSGVRQDAGSLMRVIVDLSSHFSGEAAHMMKAIAEDHAVLRHYEAKYHQRETTSGRLPRDLVEKVGFQIMVAYRLMRALRESGRLLQAKVVSRLIRHAFACDIHWDAQLDPGVMVVHGLGMAISHGARVGRGSILNQGVTLGEGIDPQTRMVGAPRVEENVHVGAGATLIGPITIGADTKIMPGALVLSSVPAGSLVEVAASVARPRPREGQGRLQRVAAGESE